MKVQLKVEYSENDVSKIVIEAHTKQFGAAPKGMEWTTSDYYRKTIVEATETENLVPVVTPQPTDTNPTTNPIQPAADMKEMF